MTDAAPAAASSRAPYSDAARFARVVLRARDLDEVGRLLARTAQRMGFHYVALVSHVAPSGAGLALHTLPRGWAELYETQRLDRVDPVLRVCRRTLTGFRWSRMTELARISERERLFMQRSRRYGLGAGFTVPLHLPGLRTASCSFVMAPGARLPTDHLLEAQLVAQFAFEAARRTGAVVPHPVRLTNRERDCVRLLGAGLTDGEIGRRLALSEETITKYLNAARRRNGYARRSQLLVAALRDGEIAADPRPPDNADDRKSNGYEA